MGHVARLHPIALTFPEVRGRGVWSPRRSASSSRKEKRRARRRAVGLAQRAYFFARAAFARAMDAMPGAVVVKPVWL
jgi:hypothetical protein